MATLKWCYLGVISGGGRSDPDVLDKIERYVNVFDTSYPDAVSYDTKEALLASLAADSMDTWNGRLPYTPERISYPVIYGGPVSFYLPDISPSFTEYPFTVQAYSCSFTAFRAGDSALNYTTLIIISALTSTDAIPPPVGTPDPVTIQLKRTTDATYSVNPADASVLPKYAAPVKFIRAEFDSTRIAVITETITGGFMIYEEAPRGTPTGPVYIYSSKRKLLHVVDTALIDQYRLYTF